MNEGFTLVELLVAISIFVLILTVSVSSMLNILNQSKKAQSLESAMNNVSHSIDAITRLLRFGYEHEVVDVNSVPNKITFSLIRGTPSQEHEIYLDTSTKRIMRVDDSVNYPITGEDIVINDLRFVLNDSDIDSIVILVNGYVGKIPSSENTFRLQTTVSKR